MRKLLVASQKGGVGKTTTSINLAAGAALGGGRVLLVEADPLSNITAALGLADHPGRRTLREAGIDLPGVLVPDVVPGLDVLSPYEDGGCPDAELSRLLALPEAAASRAHYTCLVVDTPPFLGANPNQLLASCDEFLVVMRAEALAHRTLPALLELGQRSKTAGHAIRLRGVVLTLAEGEDVGGRWERELRGRLGTRILPEVIPFDDAVTRSALSGRVAVQEGRESPATRAYLSLVASLELTSGARPASARRPAVEVLAEAARSAPEPPRPAPPVTPSRLSEQSGKRRAAKPPSRRVPAAPYSEADFRMIEEPPAPAPVSAPALAHVPAPPPPPPAPMPGGFPVATGLMWVCVAIAAGVGLRFAPLPENALPGLVGLAVAGIVVFLLNAMSREQEQEEAHHTPAPAVPPTSRPATPAPVDTRSAASRRLSGLKRRLGPRRA